MKETRCKLVVHSPLTHSELIRTTLGEIGAGKIGNYDFCSFTYKGVGRFRGNKNSSPSIGVAGTVDAV